MRISAETIGKHSWKLLWAGFVSYALFFSFFSFLNYRHFFFGDWDLALYNQVFRGFLTGHPVMSLADLPYLGLHAEVTMLVFLPFYALFPHPLTLLVLQSFVLALAVFPLFLLARMVVTETTALFFCAAYLLYPALGYVNLNEFHPECLMPFLQFFLFYYFMRRDFKKFLLFMFLCLFAKENMPLIVMMFGVLSAIQKRPKEWILWPLVASASWFFIFMKIIFPRLSEGRIGFDYIYSHMGDSLPAVAWFIVTHPVKVISWLMQARSLAYLSQIFAPLGFISLLCPGILSLALPNLLQHLLSRRMTETNIAFYYSAEFLAIVFIAGIFGFRKVSDFLSPGKRKVFRFFIFLCVLFSASLSPQVLSAIGLARGFDSDDVRTRSYQALIRALPQDAAAVATFAFLPELSRRSARLDSFHKVLTGEYYPGKPFSLPAECSAALIDFTDEKTFGDFFYKQKYRDNFKMFFSQGSWGAQMALGNAVLFKRGVEGTPLLSRTVSHVFQEGPAYIFDDNLALFKCERKRFVVEGQEGVRLIFSWSLLRRTNVPYGFRLALVNGLNEVVWRSRHPIGYYVYPTSEWMENEVVEETFGFLLPRDPGPAPWKVCLVPVNRLTGAPARVTGGRDAVSGQEKAYFSL